MITFWVAIQLLFWATVIVLAIHFFTDLDIKEVRITVYGITLGFIGIFAIAPLLMWLGKDFLGIILAIYFGWIIWKVIKGWNSWKK